MSSFFLNIKNVMTTVLNLKLGIFREQQNFHILFMKIPKIFEKILPKNIKLYTSDFIISVNDFQKQINI